MSENNIEARDRYYAEVSLKLSKAGFTPQPQEDGYLPVDWNGSRLCRVTTKDGVLYKDEDVERSGGREALDRLIDIARTTDEYMQCIESAKNRQAETVGGGYTVLSEYNGIVFAAKANEQFGCEFVTWERTYDNKGVTVGHYIEDYKSAKRDFAVRARLIPREEAESALVRITAQMPIRFSRILLGWETGPCVSGFVSGSVRDTDAVKKTALYDETSRQYPEVSDWPVVCVTYAGRNLESALGTTDATKFDLSIMNQAGDRFLKQSGVRWLGGPYELTVTAGPKSAEQQTAQSPMAMEQQM